MPHKAAVSGENMQILSKDFTQNVSTDRASELVSRHIQK